MLNMGTDSCEQWGERGKVEPGPIKPVSEGLGGAQFGCFFQQPGTAAVQPSEVGEAQVGARKIMRKEVTRRGGEFWSLVCT